MSLNLGQTPNVASISIYCTYFTLKGRRNINIRILLGPISLHPTYRPNSSDPSPFMGCWIESTLERDNRGWFNRGLATSMTRLGSMLTLNLGLNLNPLTRKKRPKPKTESLVGSASRPTIYHM
ncbi:hypothetical protein VNO77_10348 [Canavalia gladiata]|uniref:Uncharacterized protein n=1 Tax=Canavalia gladiata TaxID=3824 RepID=A0AAN9MFS0_CANGL